MIKNLIDSMIFFAVNCVHALKEMTNPSDLTKSVPFFMEVFFVLFLNFLSIVFVFIFFNDISDNVKVSYAISSILLINGLWFIKNIMSYILNVLKKLGNDDFKKILDQEKLCLDATCCIPGNVSYYIALSSLSVIGILSLILWQIWTSYYGVYDLYIINALLLIFIFACLIHSDKRIYEISKLLSKDGIYKDDEWLVSVKKLTRDKFVYVSLKGFIVGFSLLCFSVIFTMFLNEDGHYLIYYLVTFFSSFIIFINQLTLRGLLIPFRG